MRGENLSRKLKKEKEKIIHPPNESLVESFFFQRNKKCPSAFVKASVAKVVLVKKEES